MIIDFVAQDHAVDDEDSPLSEKQLESEYCTISVYSIQCGMNFCRTSRGEEFCGSSQT